MIEPRDFETNLPQYELVLNEDVLVIRCEVLPWERIDQASLQMLPSDDIAHSGQKKALQILFYVAMMACSVLIVLELISGLWLGAVVAAFLAYGMWASRRVRVPTVLLRLHDGREIRLFQTQDAALAKSMVAKIALAKDFSKTASDA